MIFPSEVHDHSLALILAGEDKNGKEEWVVVYGTGRWDANDLYFIHNEDKVSFCIPRNTLSQLKKVDDDISSIINADYCLILSVGNLPDGADETEYIKTGLKWPN